ncbi:erythromycin esterase family protein [Jiangella endophytica]|uniref:erythromycin esterase family protein n=1 Tax=Jiangella endophytica TaxID=1623398 RepID=UPI000E348885|nr:erythromycin esterase family protein [Jiangella endophytica]
MKTRTTVLSLVAGTAALAMVATPAMVAAPAQATPPPAPGSPVTRWAERHAVAVPGDPAAPGRDLTTVARAAAGAQVIGLGEPGHLIGEVTELQARYLRHLVTYGGVRAVAFEMDWTAALPLNDYVLGARDDLDAVLGTLEDIWQTTEMRDVFRWLRHYNDTHADDVEVAGSEYFATGPAAYDAVAAYVAANAPERMAELEAQYEWVEPETDDIGAHLGAYMGVRDKAPYVAAAYEVERIVASIEPGAGHEVVAHHARQIRFWYEAFSLPWGDIPTYRDARAAENVRWWQRHTDARTVYWAASAHVADAPRLTLTEPGEEDMTYASAGSYLEDWYGRRYVPIGFTFDQGTYRTGDGATIELPPALDGWFEQPLGDVAAARFVLRIDRAGPPAVRDWLDAPLVTRGRPDYGDRSIAYGGTLGEWFDVVVHTQAVTPAHPL